MKTETPRVPKTNLRTCARGHQYRKSSDCPVCPLCETGNAPQNGILSLLNGPARRALENAGIKTEADLAAHSENEILKLHGMGKASLPVLRSALEAAGLKFKS